MREEGEGGRKRRGREVGRREGEERREEMGRGRRGEREEGGREGNRRKERGGNKGVSYVYM